MNVICTDEEISRLEKDSGVNLPLRYKEFLIKGDIDFQRALVGSDFSPPELFQLQIWGKELLEENDFPFRLGEKDFVFYMHQGYQFCFFNVDEGDGDPPVYYYLEGNEKPSLGSNKFSDWLEGVKRSFEQSSGGNKGSRPVASS